MLSGGPNWELQANVILYWQGLQCFEGEAKIWQQLSRRRRRNSDNLVLVY